MMRRIYFYLIFQLAVYTSLTGQVIKPYLQSPSDTSVWISWKTSSNPESKVIYGNDSLAMQIQVSGHCEILSDVGYPNNYYYHSVHLTDLAPDHYYYYRIITGNLQSFAYRFRTQPTLGSKPETYRVLILGDHQLKDNDHYQRLMKAAREKVHEKYGGTIEEQINLIINDGDQVDEGTLDQYEHVHFEPSAVLSGNIPIMTSVGNHEFYGTLGISAYYPHFFYDDLGYKGIVSPGGENYYSYQEGNIVFLHLSSEHTTDEQIAWVQQIVDAVKTDPTVDWLVSVAHRPIQAEQFVGDISVYVREKIVPILAQTKKSTLLITGHHHLYARGQVRDYPIYHIISGAASWDQYWGQSVEKDFDDVQKTIDYWAYQIATFDNVKKEMTVESYAIGSPKLGLTLNNELIDSFYRKPDVAPPPKPYLITQPGDSVSLPYTFVSSPYNTVTSEPLNSTQFQISSGSDFLNPLVDQIRDYENLYGNTGSPDFKPVDINKNINILDYEIGKNKLPNGTYYIRVRHRDRNIEWSEWSDPIEFRVKGSVPGFTSLTTSKTVYSPNESIIVNYLYGKGNAKDWIGIYKEGETPGPTPSTDWKYVTGSSGSLSLQVSTQGKYFIAFFENDSFDELAERLSVSVQNIPVLTLNKAGYEVGEAIHVNYTNAPAFLNDWIGIYKQNDIPGPIGSTLWKYTSASAGNLDFTGLKAGYYFITYFLEDGYTEACPRTIFSVGSELATVSADQAIYQRGQSIQVKYENGPGTGNDWLDLYRQNTPAEAPILVDRLLIGNLQSGSLSFNGLTDTGEYFIGLCINNSGIIVSNKASFTVEANTASFDRKSILEDIVLIPSPTTGPFRVKTSNLRFSEITLKIFSMTGRTIYEKLLQSTNNEYSEVIDISGAPAGVYLVCIQSKNRVLTGKIVIY
jgi:hypothetical protein